MRLMKTLKELGDLKALQREERDAKQAWHDLVAADRTGDDYIAELKAAGDAYVKAATSHAAFWEQASTQTDGTVIDGGKF